MSLLNLLGRIFSFFRKSIPFTWYQHNPAFRLNVQAFKNEFLGAETDDETGAIEHQVNEMIDLERRIANASFSFE